VKPDQLTNRLDEDVQKVLCLLTVDNCRQWSAPLLPPVTVRAIRMPGID
jgi:hypothetical protein